LLFVFSLVCLRHVYDQEILVHHPSQPCSPHLSSNALENHLRLWTKLSFTVLVVNCHSHHFHPAYTCNTHPYRDYT